MRNAVFVAAALMLAVAPLPVFSQQAEYIGKDTCATCHPDVVASFDKTAHAKSLDVLKAAGSDKDAQCLACHTTGANGTKYTDGAVTCESCHGPGSAHMAAADETARKAAINRAVGEDVCKKCHTPDWSPNFDYAGYSANGLHSVTK